MLAQTDCRSRPASSSSLVDGSGSGAQFQERKQKAERGSLGIEETKERAAAAGDTENERKVKEMCTRIHRGQYKGEELVEGLLWPEKG